MSLATWKKEFYPIPANKSKGGLAAVNHSLKKWEGALKKNTKKHGLIYDDNAVRYINDDPIERLDFYSETCALCEHYYHADRTNPKDRCGKCPIFKVTGETCINRFLDSDNRPIPMIRLLRQVKKVIETKR